jgi:hypothetical protein
LCRVIKEKMDQETTDVVALQIERADPADLKMLVFRV